VTTQPRGADQPPAGQLQLGSGFGTSVQTPRVPGSAQDLQGPTQAVAQQTPCAQKPLLQVSLLVHGVPGRGRWQDPSRQTVPAVQCWSPLQNGLQTLPPHR
jgi:hypothetical protein